MTLPEHGLIPYGTLNAAGQLYGCTDPTCSWGWRARTPEEAAKKFAERHAPPPKITKATQPTIAERLWRCSSCGKWSHAKRKPPRHERAKWAPEETDVVIRAADGRDEDGGPATFWWVACGPFEEWEAWKVERS
jgi:hypothetical protein